MASNTSGRCDGDAFRAVSDSTEAATCDAEDANVEHETDADELGDGKAVLLEVALGLGDDDRLYFGDVV